jgi:hypothetical protein
MILKRRFYCWLCWSVWRVVCRLAQLFGEADVMTLDRFSPLYDLPKRRYVLLLGAGGQLGQECAAIPEGKIA